jgi:hypothetical protein
LLHSFTLLYTPLLSFTQPANDLSPETKKQTKTQRTKITAKKATKNAANIYGILNRKALRLLWVSIDS